MAVNIFFTGKIPAEAAESLPLLEEAAETALGAEFRKGTVNIIYTGDKGIRKINREFLNRDRVTDVIAFNYPPVPVKDKSIVMGEIYVCLSQAKRQARAMGHSWLTEILTLTVHGSLHLAGMDDSTQELRDGMNRKTTRIIKKIAPGNIPNW